MAALLRILVKGERHLPPLNWGFLYGLMENDSGGLGGGKSCSHSQVISHTFSDTLETGYKVANPKESYFIC